MNIYFCRKKLILARYAVFVESEVWSSELPNIPSQNDIQQQLRLVEILVEKGCSTCENILRKWIENVRVSNKIIFYDDYITIPSYDRIFNSRSFVQWKFDLLGRNDEIKIIDGFIVNFHYIENQ